MRKLRQIIVEVLKSMSLNLKESYKFYDYNEDDSNHFEEIGMDEYQVYSRSREIAKDGGLNILRDKNLSGVIVDENSIDVVGALWVSDDKEVFSFDVAVDKNHRNKGLSHILIKKALEIYDYMNEAYYDYNNKDMPIEVDVINPILAKTLKDKYGFKVIEKITGNRVLMSK